ncbi:hypothetical protein L9F63_011244 [Diploptera punctata]|uniref:Peptidase S1 domain-containing protein n=1 Tax=Diploptera punctata TaxID=6984 RepID=A0AAD8AHH1_DIPPU|nr:hypothetical protein L9F63_011244 [Diploptera punctata]
MCRVLIISLFICLVPGLSKENGPLEQFQGRIVGGEDADIEDFSYQLSLEINGNHSCGASIIGEEWALTAAHCVEGVKANQLTIRAGTSVKGKGGTLHKISELVRHPKYHYITTDNDIAVLKVSPPFEFNEKVQPVRLRKKEPKAGTRGVVTGWGAKVSGGPLQSQLQFVTVPIVDREECNKNYGEYGGITRNMICAFGEGQDACKGDSGSPLVIKGELAGIVSWGMGCNVREHPGVYSNIATLREFITSNTGIK